MIFDDAKIGDKFVTDSKEIPFATYLGEDMGDFQYRLAVPVLSNITNKMSYAVLLCDETGCSKCDINIVSRYQQQGTTKEEIEEFAKDFIRTHKSSLLTPPYIELMDAYKKGCYKILDCIKI